LKPQNLSMSRRSVERTFRGVSVREVRSKSLALLHHHDDPCRRSRTDKIVRVPRPAEFPCMPQPP
jgi:hypothetical protein